jgi:hypothetical protein
VCKTKLNISETICPYANLVARAKWAPNTTIGQKGLPTPRWVKKGAQPHAGSKWAPNPTLGQWYVFWINVLGCVWPWTRTPSWKMDGRWFLPNHRGHKSDFCFPWNITLSILHLKIIGQFTYNIWQTNRFYYHISWELDVISNARSEKRCLVFHNVV